MKNDITFQDFFESIALEAQAIDRVLSEERRKLQERHALLGKSWYALGLESNDSDVEKDNANKQGIIHRMIDVVLNFIKRIIEKIIERNEKTGELLKKVRDTIDYDTKEQVESVRKSALAALHVMNLACRVNSAGRAAAAAVTKLKA